MKWDYSFTDKARKELNKLGVPSFQRIVLYLEDRIKGKTDPRQFGKQLKGELG